MRRYEDEPKVKPLHQHHLFDMLMGVLLANIEVKYAYTLPDVKKTLLKICSLVYNQIRQEVMKLNVDNENKPARYCLGLLRDKYTAWRKKINALVAK